MDISDQARHHGRDFVYMQWNRRARRGAAPDVSRKEVEAEVETYAAELSRGVYSFSYIANFVLGAEKTITERHKAATDAANAEWLDG